MDYLIYKLFMSFILQVYGWVVPGQPLDGDLTLLVEEQSAPIAIQVAFVKGFSVSKTLTITDSPITAGNEQVTH